MIPTVSQVRDAFPDWTQGQCRSYRQGIAAARREEVEEERSNHYYYGAADEVGEAAEAEEWFDQVANWPVRFQWWKES